MQYFVKNIKKLYVIHVSLKYIIILGNKTFIVAIFIYN